MTASDPLVKPLSTPNPPTDQRDVPQAETRLKVLANFREMAYELVHYRELLWQMVLRDIRLRYKQAVMGFGWAVFMPMMVVGAGFMVKYAMAHISGQQLAMVDIASMTVKALAWSFFVGAIAFATSSLVSNISLVTKIYFPREVFPLSAVLTQAFDSSIGSIVGVSLLMLLLGVELSVQALWVIPLVIILLMFTVGTTLFLSCGNVFFRDVKYIVQVMVTFGIFFTPVFYEPKFFGATGSTLMMLNPLAPILEGLRLAVIEHHNLFTPWTLIRSGQQILIWQPWYLLYSAAWAVFGLLGAWYLFHKLEFIYAEYI